MKSPLIQVRSLTINFLGAEPVSPAPVVAAGLGNIDQFAEPLRPFANVPLNPPAIGEYWQGQGGIYGGIMQDEDGVLRHKIFAATDIGRFAWGQRGTETGATSKINGVLNTTTLRDAEGSFPAAEAASEYTADGHHDFVLPSIAELFHAYNHMPASFAKEAYWSSSQYSAYTAFFMAFEGGWLYHDGKVSERLVRPVRSLPIQ